MSNKFFHIMAVKNETKTGETKHRVAVFLGRDGKGSLDRNPRSLRENKVAAGMGRYVGITDLKCATYDEEEAPEWVDGYDVGSIEEIDGKTFDTLTKDPAFKKWSLRDSIPLKDLKQLYDKAMEDLYAEKAKVRELKRLLDTSR